MNYLLITILKILLITILSASTLRSLYAFNHYRKTAFNALGLPNSTDSINFHILLTLITGFANLFSFLSFILVALLFF